MRSLRARGRGGEDPAEVADRLVQVVRHGVQDPQQVACQGGGSGPVGGSRVAFDGDPGRSAARITDTVSALGAAPGALAVTRKPPPGCGLPEPTASTTSKKDASPAAVTERGSPVSSGSRVSGVYLWVCTSMSRRRASATTWRSVMSGCASVTTGSTLRNRPTRSNPMAGWSRSDIGTPTATRLPQP